MNRDVQHPPRSRDRRRWFVVGLCLLFVLQLLPHSPISSARGAEPGTIDFPCAQHSCACSTSAGCLEQCCCFPDGPGPSEEGEPRPDGPCFDSGCGGGLRLMTLGKGSRVPPSSLVAEPLWFDREPMDIFEGRGLPLESRGSEPSTPPPRLDRLRA